MKQVIAIWTDGGARGNPGPAGIGITAVLENEEGTIGAKPIFEIAEYIGQTTNNQAEYQALIAALERTKQYCHDISLDTNNLDLHLFTDSELLAYQLQGRYKVKNTDLQPKYQKVVDLLSDFSAYTITPIRRERNQIADKLVNQAIDQALAEVAH